MARVVPAATLPAEAGDPLDLWAFAGRLFLSTGARNGGRSGIYSSPDGRQWTRELDSVAETINKIRDYDGTLFAFYESPAEGENWLVRRQTDATWTFVAVPREGHVVGGRGIGVNYFGPSPLFVGASQDWDATLRGEVFEQAGGFGLRRALSPALMWELEFDEHGRLWEFFSAFGEETPGFTFVNGVAVANPPDNGPSHACWFPGSGHMYTCGSFAGSAPGSPAIHRSVDGVAWQTVFSFTHSEMAAHVQAVRGGTELWAVAQEVFDVARSVDGETWELVEVPAHYPNPDDINHTTALGEFNGAVYVATKDAEANLIRIFAEVGAGRGGRSLLQVL